MPQLSYSETMAEGYEGMKADSGFDRVESFAAEELTADEGMPFGRFLVAGTNKAKQVKLPQGDVAVLTFDANFITGNTIDLDVNGASIAQVTFTTSHANTATLLVAAIALLSGVTCTVDTTGRIYTITVEDETALVENVVVASGSTQAGSVTSYSTNDVLRGISIHQHTENGKYNDGETVSTLRKGVVLMTATEAIAIDSVLYAVVAAGVTNGQAAVTVGANLLTTAVARSAAAAAGDIIKVEIDLP